MLRRVHVYGSNLHARPFQHGRRRERRLRGGLPERCRGLCSACSDASTCTVVSCNSDCCNTGGKIQRGSLDETAVEDVVTAGIINPLGIALDATAGKMCWADKNIPTTGRRLSVTGRRLPAS